MRGVSEKVALNSWLVCPAEVEMVDVFLPLWIVASRRKCMHVLFAVDPRRAETGNGSIQWRVHLVEWLDLQL